MIQNLVFIRRERLFLRVTIYGRIKESKELANIDIKLMNGYPEVKSIYLISFIL